jgi:hypothetical protein
MEDPPERIDVAPHRGAEDALAAGLDHAIEEMAVDRLERKRRERRPDRGHLLGRERDQVRVAAHEAQVFSVDRDRGDVGGEEHAAPGGAARPMQHGSAWKMAAAPYERHARQELERLTLPRPDRSIGTHDPAPVARVHVDWDAAERPAPLHHRRIEVRV